MGGGFGLLRDGVNGSITLSRVAVYDCIRHLNDVVTSAPGNGLGAPQAEFEAGNWRWEGRGFHPATRASYVLDIFYFFAFSKRLFTSAQFTTFHQAAR